MLRQNPSCGWASIQIPRLYIIWTHLRIWNWIQGPANQAANAHRRADRLNLFSDKLINLYQLPLAAFSQLPNLLTLNRSVMRERPVWTTRDFTQTISTDDQWNMICMPRCERSTTGYECVFRVGANCSLSSSVRSSLSRWRQVLRNARNGTSAYWKLCIENKFSKTLCLSRAFIFLIQIKTLRTASNHETKTVI